MSENSTALKETVCSATQYIRNEKVNDSNVKKQLHLCKREITLHFLRLIFSEASVTVQYS